MAPTPSIDRADRILGTLWGQAVGDALGLGTEFLTKDEVHRHYPGDLTDYGQIIQDYHRERCPRGAWTDDTDMMLCILRSYGKDGFDLTRVAQWIDLAHDTTDIADLHLDHQPSIGYTLRTLAASLWCYWHAPSFEEGLLAIVNEGGDADTNGAVAASLLGALYGNHTIPTLWLTTLHDAPTYGRLLRPFLSKLNG